MENSSIIALGFLIFGSAFMYTLLKSLWILISTDVKGKADAKTMLNHFKLPLLALVVLIIFASVIVPMLK